MAGKARTEGLERHRRVLARFSVAAKAELRKANERNAIEFFDLVKLTVPRGDPNKGHLADTLELREGDDEDSTATLVSIGGALGGEKYNYPMHLEGGHRARDGSHVPGKPYWNPAKRVIAKRAKGRVARALGKVVKAATATT